MAQESQDLPRPYLIEHHQKEIGQQWSEQITHTPLGHILELSCVFRLNSQHHHIHLFINIHLQTFLLQLTHTDKADVPTFKVREPMV